MANRRREERPGSPGTTFPDRKVNKPRGRASMSGGAAATRPMGRYGDVVRSRDDILSGLVATKMESGMPVSGKRHVAPQPIVAPEGAMFAGQQAPGVRFRANEQMPYTVESGDTLTSIAQGAPNRPNRTNLLQSIWNWATPASMFPDNLRFEGNPMGLEQALYEIGQMNDLGTYLQPGQSLNLPQGMGYNIWGNPTRG